MRANIDIDDALMPPAQLASGLATKKAAVEAGLRLPIRLEGQKDILGLAGKVRWTGNLDESRLGHDAA